MVYELKYKDDIIDAVDAYDKLDGVFEMLENMKRKYEQADDPTAIYLHVAQRNILSAKNHLAYILPRELLNEMIDNKEI